MEGSLYTAIGIAMFGIGLFGVVALAQAMKKILAVNICGVGIFMIFIANSTAVNGSVDYVPHAIVLTGIVVAVAGTALALSLVCRIYDKTKQQVGK
ncbi:MULTISPECIES: NADH-quinone oxidoreductase subunit K [Pseudoalteromonas]|uniref:NADH-quinone oxidoreductase subunit K n=1 Tax=Pseudoalteromonas TaxID=53246 RepID=UPI001EFC5696|nr:MULTISPECIES: NADH-quinone oxidoreductase subunit K [Pseudoalteromonas]MCG9760017.1 NADH-quinone oxidoreductase subunit K [Pseudoalteromonas sp. Isolate6]